jgi:class 3 adenylate cyclase/predicted ATPase
MEQQLVNWLRTIGLEQYSQVLLENGVDLSVLPDLTDQDLEKLGILLGHRRKLLRAIAQHIATADTAQGSHDGRTARSDGERRQLTVMFCDFVGSNELSGRLDPEDLSVVIRRYHDTCLGIITRYEGIVPQFLSDGVLAYFCYPRAHEDDAERAVRAGLDIIAAVGRLSLSTGVPLQARIGIATGLVVVGDLSTHSLASEPSAVGETPNLAARVQALAPAGTVAVAASTRRLLGEVFVLRSFGSCFIKGLAEPVDIWTVDGVATSESRFESVRSHNLTSFVGREPEAALLEACWNRARQGEGQIALVCGEAGIGKSRFAVQFTEQIADQSCTLLRYQCSPYHTSSALYPMIEQLKHAARLAPADPPATQLDKLEALLARTNPDPSRVTPTFAALLSIPTEERYPTLNLGAAQQRRQTLSALLDQWEALSRQQPVILLYEDVHWADASSLEILDLLVERIRRLPVLVVVTYRPEFEPSWDGLPNATNVTLGRLGPAQVRHMVDQLAQGMALPDDVVAQIVTKTDGVPLFVEELTKAVLESGALGGTVRRDWSLGPIPPLAIPSTLQDSLMARLDRLSLVKDIAQVAATIGREFTYELLHAVSGRDHAALDQALRQLEEAELLFRIGVSPDIRYSFKHALVRDAAYESLLKNRRVMLHQRTANALSETFPAMAEAQPELVAHHFTEAGLVESAVEWWSKAGQQSLARSAFIEASTQYRQAITLADRLPDKPERRLGRLKLQIAYSSTLLNVRGHGVPETAAAFARAWELASRLEDPSERFPVYYGLWVGGHSRAELAPAQRWSAAFLRDAEQRPDAPETGIAYRLVGTTAWTAGDMLTARARLEQALAIYDPDRDRGLRFRYGFDPGVVTMLQLAVVLWQIGEGDRARGLADNGLSLALQSGHIPTVIYAHGCIGIFHALRRDRGRILENAEKLRDVMQAQELQTNWYRVAILFVAWARWFGGDRTVGLDEMRETVEICANFGFLLYLPLYRMLFAEAQADAGDILGALATMRDALADTERSRHRWLQSELHRVHAGVLLRCDVVDRPAVEAELTRGLAIARAQHAKQLEFRAALDLARLYCATDRPGAARDLLVPLIAVEHQVSEPAELRQAQELLAGL